MDPECPSVAVVVTLIDFVIKGGVKALVILILVTCIKTGDEISSLFGWTGVHQSPSKRAKPSPLSPFNPIPRPGAIPP